MKKALFLLCIVALFASPSAFACATCMDDGNCDFVNGFALYCWYDWAYPEDPGPRCFTTGHCYPGRSANPASLTSELTVASVEIQQGETVVARTIVPPSAQPARTARLNAVAVTASLDR